MLRKVLIALSLAVASASTFAGGLWGSVMLASYHTDRQIEYNEVNHGVGVEYSPTDSDDIKIVASVYKNSYSRGSVFVGAAWTPFSVGPVKIGAAAGAVTGYKLYNYKAGPVATGLVSYEGEKYGANLLILPPTNVKGEPPTWVFAIQAKMKF